jgi:hypothetical protein
MGKKWDKIKIISWWFVVSLLVSLVFSSYNLQLKRIVGDNYSTLAINNLASPLLMDETIAYGSKTQEVLNGHFKLSDMFIFEYKQTASPLMGEMIPATLMAGMAKLAGGVSQSFVLADMIWPSVCFLSLSWLIYLMTKKPYLSVVGSLGVMFFSHYLSLMPFLPSIIGQIAKALSVGSYSHFIRSFHPQVTMPFFILTTIALYKLMNQKSLSYRLIGVLITSLGAMFYSYLFFWVFSLALAGFFGLQAIVTKNHRFLKSLLLGAGGGVIIGLPYLLNMWQFYQLDLSRDFNNNFNFQAKGSLKHMLVLLIMWALSRWLIKKKVLASFWQIFFLSGIGLIVSIELLGFNVDNTVGHMMLRIFYPYMIVFGWIVILSWFKKDNKLVAVLLSLCLLAYQAKVHYQYFKINAQMFQIEPERKEMFEWLNSNTQADSVVLTDSLINNLYLTIMTHNNVFIPHSYLSLAGDEEVIDRFLFVNKLAGNSKERIVEMLSLTEENKKLRAKKRFNFDNCGGHYLFFRRFISHDYYNCAISEEELNKIIKQYDELTLNLKKYRADYWLTDKSFDQGLLLWENGQYKIYSLGER